ncbi:hypothetical protein HMPREF9184_00272 [Streptococcus sp. oral taxon 058 str. F0407]|nr:hypothetical protein HMPREF9184_00272 [Streptococcus sp. oral taxon 058 str. F0407]
MRTIAKLLLLILRKTVKSKHFTVSKAEYCIKGKHYSLFKN